MAPRLDGLADAFRTRLEQMDPGEGFRVAAEEETLAVGRRFEAEVETYLAEAVSYLDDEVLQGLKALDVDGQFGALIWESIDQARASLAARLRVIREVAAAASGPQ